MPIVSELQTQVHWNKAPLLLSAQNFNDAKIRLIPYIICLLNTYFSKTLTSRAREPDICFKKNMKFTVKKILMDGLPCLAVHNKQFIPDYPLKMKSIKGAWWNPIEVCWILPDSVSVWSQFETIFPNCPVEITPEDNRVPEASKQQARSPRDYEFPAQFDHKLFRPKEKIGVSRDFARPDWLWLHLPGALVSQYLEVVKSIHGRRWNPEQWLWEIPYTKTSFRFLASRMPGVVDVNFTPDADIPEHYSLPTVVHAGREAQFKPARYEKAVIALEQSLLLKRYSHRTIKAYKNCFRNFIRFYDETKPSAITRAQIDAFIAHEIRKKNISESHQNQYLSAIKWFYTMVIEQDDKVEYLLRPKKPQKLPHVLTETEVVRLLGAVDNIKHRFILTLIYSAGLRLGEIIRLQIADVHIENKRLFIRGGKGKKDRFTLLADRAIILLQQYLDVYKPIHWLIEGQTGGQYSERSVQEIFTRAKEKTKINPFATVHTLRHSFATHLSEKGIDLQYIQELLGHESLKTTEIYLHLTKKGWDKLKSPLDSLDL